MRRHRDPSGLSAVCCTKLPLSRMRFCMQDRRAKLVKGDRQRHSQANRCARIAWRLCRERGASACILHDKLKRLPDYGACNNRPQERPHPSGRTAVGVGHKEDWRRRSRSEFATKHLARRGQISRAHNTSKHLRETLSGVVSVKWLSRKSVTVGFLDSGPRSRPESRWVERGRRARGARRERSECQ
jgi:hypothetical protein